MKYFATKVLLLFFSVTSFGASAAVSAPSFTGTWKLNLAKSDFNRVTGPRSMTLKVDQTDKELRVRTSLVDRLGERSDTARYVLDGRVNQNSSGIATETIALLDGDILVLDVKQGLNLAYKERWSLSSDGKTLTIKRHHIFTRSELTEEFILDKQ